MSCSEGQNQMANTDFQEQSSLNDVLTHNFVPQSQTSQTPQNSQNGPYAATGGSTLQQVNQMLQAGTTTGQTAAANPLSPITNLTQPMPMTLNSLQYLNAALRTQIGRKVTVDFLIGTNTFVDRTGTLLAVGANYIIINEIESDDLLFCDYYSIKFVKAYR